MARTITSSSFCTAPARPAPSSCRWRPHGDRCFQTPALPRPTRPCIIASVTNGSRRKEILSIPHVSVRRAKPSTSSLATSFAGNGLPTPTTGWRSAGIAGSNSRARRGRLRSMERGRTRLVRGSAAATADFSRKQEHADTARARKGRPHDSVDGLLSRRPKPQDGRLQGGSRRRAGGWTHDFDHRAQRALAFFRKTFG
jgi:hypothetical protein